MPSPRYLTLLGPTGAGKSTLGRALAEQLGLAYISTGAALRSMAEADNALGRSIQQRLSAGQYATTATMKKLVSQTLADSPQGLIIDGFPRTLAQAQWLDTQIPPNQLQALLLDLSETALTTRLLARNRADDTPALIS